VIGGFTGGPRWQDRYPSPLLDRSTNSRGSQENPEKVAEFEYGNNREVSLGLGMVSGYALRTRQRRSSTRVLSAPQTPAVAPLPGTCALDLRLNEFTLSSLSRSAVFFIGAQ
jgi:hypothetical protein